MRGVSFDATNWRRQKRDDARCAITKQTPQKPPRVASIAGGRPASRVTQLWAPKSLGAASWLASVVVCLFGAASVGGKNLTFTHIITNKQLGEPSVLIGRLISLEYCWC